MTLMAEGNGKDNARDTGLLTSKGRPVIFTSERMEQIRNLVERGHSREEIATIVGCTLGSLQVTCSKHGVSLRRQRNSTSYNAAPVKRTPIAPDPIPVIPGPARSAADVLEPPGGWPPGHPFHADDTTKGAPITFTLRINYGTRVYDIPLAIDGRTLSELACIADINGMKLSEMIARALVVGVRKITS